MTRRVFTGAAGADLVATQRGEGPGSVLLLHGGGQTRHAWDTTLKKIAATGRRAVSLDQRGHGESAWVEDGDYTPAAFAADAIAVAAAIEAETGRKPVAVGASLGGLASMMALALAPDRPPFTALVLVDVVPKPNQAGIDQVQNFMRERASEGFATIEEAAEAIAAYLPHRPRPRSTAGLAKNLRLHEDGRWRWHWDPRLLDGPLKLTTARAEAEARASAAMAAITIPSLLVRGGASELVTPETVADFRALSPTTRYVDIAGAHHMVAGDRNDAFSEAVLDFLESLRAEATAD